jgi:hypothetical protein
VAQIKHRSRDVVNPVQAGGGLMATIGSTLTGAKFIENDDVRLFLCVLKWMVADFLGAVVVV